MPHGVAPAKLIFDGICWIPLRSQSSTEPAAPFVVRNHGQKPACCGSFFCELRPVQCDHGTGATSRQQIQASTEPNSTESSSLLNSLSTLFDGGLGDRPRPARPRPMRDARSVEVSAEHWRLTEPSVFWQHSVEALVRKDYIGRPKGVDGGRKGGRRLTFGLGNRRQ